MDSKDKEGKMSASELVDDESDLLGNFGGPRLVTGQIYLVLGNGFEYVGSTRCRNLQDRLARHQSDFELHTMQLRKPTTCHVCFEGSQPPTIQCLEKVEFPENDDTLLRQVETRHILGRPACVNKAVPFVSEEEQRANKKAKDREYDARRSKARNESSECGCGGRVSQASKKTHERSVRHVAWLNAIK